MAFPPALIAQCEHDTGLAATLGDLAAVGDRVGDRLVEKNMLAGLRRQARGFKMHVVRRRIDDGLDLRVGENGLIARRCAAAIFGGEGRPLLFRARKTGDDLELAGTLDRVGQHVGPPAHAKAGDAQWLDHGHHFESECQLAPIDSTACWAMRSSVTQSPPATPMPPMHSPSAMTGQPPCIAVQRSGPAASARPSACAASSSCACAPRAEVMRLLEAAQTALVVDECTVWKRPPSMRSSKIKWPPASAMAIDTAMPACLAASTAVAIIFLAPSIVRRLLLVTYM